jgi:exodeoxyribonuclease V beta subunit
MQSASQRFLQPHELLYWFEQQCNEENSSAIGELEAEQRLESDGDLIRIVTQHGAKGLEYPVVFIPFATRHKDPLKFGNKSVSYFEYHDDQGQLCLSLDGDEQAKKSMANEAYAESIRLLYVAITRAEHRCYILSTGFDKYASSPLGKTLKWAAEQDIALSLQQLVDDSLEAISLQHVSFDDITPDTYHLIDSNSKAPELHVSKFVGKIERDWWLSSFSALSRNLRHGGVSTPDRDSEGLLNKDVTNFNSDDKVLRFQLAKGAHSGNLLHDIFEESNFKDSNDINSNLLESIKWPLVKYGELASGYNEIDLVAWLDEILTTPLSSSDDNTNSYSLSEITTHKTLRESEFYFPMESANVTALEELLTDHRISNRVSEDNKNQGHVNAVRLPSYKTLKGMMHGFIDLVFEKNDKYYVCDYKSSHLGDKFGDYNQVALRHNIEGNYYDLQYLIYSLALHRHLKQNVVDYDATQHFGGVFYLYLRGMTNDERHHGAGVYYQHISSNELNQLDTLFLGNINDKELGEKLYEEQR